MEKQPTLAEAIQKAIRCRNVAAARQLVEDAENSNKVAAALLERNEGCLPIHAAIGSEYIRNRHPGFIELLARKCPTSLLRGNRTPGGDTPIHLAIREKAPDLALMLLDIAGTDHLFACVNRDGRGGMLPIHLAVQHWEASCPDSLRLIEALVYSDEDKRTLQTGDRSGNLPIHVAVMANAAKLIPVLLKADTNKKSLLRRNNRGQLPLHLAVDRHLNFDWNLARPLIQADATKKSVATEDNYGNLPIHLLIRKQGANKTSALLLSMLVNADEQRLSLRKDRNETLPIDLAIRSCACLDVVSCLLSMDNRSEKADLTKELREEGNELVRLACCKNYSPPLVEVVKLLVDHYKCTKDILVAEEEEDSAIFKACRSNISSMELSRLLWFSLEQRINLLPGASRLEMRRRLHKFGWARRNRKTELGNIVDVLVRLERQEKLFLLKLAVWKSALTECSGHDAPSREICLVRSGADQIASLVEEFLVKAA